MLQAPAVGGEPWPGLEEEAERQGEVRGGRDVVPGRAGYGAGGPLVSSRV